MTIFEFVDKYDLDVRRDRGHMGGWVVQIGERVRGRTLRDAVEQFLDRMDAVLGEDGKFGEMKAQRRADWAKVVEAEDALALARVTLDEIRLNGWTDAVEEQVTRLMGPAQAKPEPTDRTFTVEDDVGELIDATFVGLSVFDQVKLLRSNLIDVVTHHYVDDDLRDALLENVAMSADVPYRMTTTGDDDHDDYTDEAEAIKANYEGGVCPDCGESIPDDAVNGSECDNCGHVFYDAEHGVRTDD